MNQVPIGMARCVKTGASHEPVFDVDNERLACFDCYLPISQWNVHLPERDDTITLWLSQTTIYEDPF
ncbi:MAG TPA: hypothetical protein VFH56_02835 [Acidimicrobiales bacterium]|nr:hypothetical protein [Acidimicrobiales bacterium]